MTAEIWFTYVAAVLLFMSTPGPSHLLMMSNSMANGFRRSLATAAGDLTANVLQMLAAGIGLGAIILASENAFLAIKWLGVAYLIWMGIDKIRTSGKGDFSKAARTSIKALWSQGFVTSSANPKAIVFFAALFPQFISSKGAFWAQFVTLSATYIVLDGMFLTLYGSAAGWIEKRMSVTARVWLDRLAGGFLIGAGILLSLKTASR